MAEARDKKAVMRGSWFVKTMGGGLVRSRRNVEMAVFRETLQGRVAGAGGSRLVLTALSHTSPRRALRNAG